MILVTLMMEAIVPPKRRSLQEPQGVTSQKTPFCTASVVPSSPIPVTLMMEAIVPPKRRSLQGPHGVTSQKTPFCTATVVPSSPILVTLMKEEVSSSETSVFTRATRRNIKENTILHS
jgi:hypothetical protein